MKNNRNYSIMLHVLRPYGINGLNRNDLGDIKTAIIGDTIRSTYSSQSHKYAIRLATAKDNIRTNFAINEMFNHLTDIAISDGIDIYTEKFIKYLIAVCDFKTKDSNYTDMIANIQNGIGVKMSTTEVTSDLELNAIAKSVYDSFKNGDNEKTAKEALADIHKQIDKWTAMFGRMTTTATFSTVYGAAKISDAYSIDECINQYDFFTVVDTLAEKYSDQPGAANMQEANFASNVMYQSFALDINQFLSNYTKDENITVDEYANEVADFIIDVLKAFAYISPTGKQNTKYSQPTPAAIACIIGKGVQEYTMDSAFNSVVKKDKNTVVYNGINRMEQWLENELIDQDYDEVRLWSKETINNVTNCDCIQSNKMNDYYNTFLKKELHQTIVDYIKSM